MRTDGQSDFVFMLNFSGENQEVTLDDRTYSDLLTGEVVQGNVHLQQE